ncbi:MAG: histidine kinase [Alteromonas sp.]|jgi:HPt (histidine-containing phosphotransfer) domain-containing protein|uniref:Hpt domain-containing protein n=1 Tax=unclassified Alteromonas TaxID=2614992 RepID=UPI000903B6B2|nr:MULTISPECIES: Hpt domain-containing protein [unclassified Alteromonas]APE05837.1 histidine kinase [Alteromonas sp. RW2A1]AUC87738.1 histidine kinase [Alteromonas sp. MB-3u-76]MAI64852.1 histidine kinase [Alteromonas sp.]
MDKSTTLVDIEFGLSQLSGNKKLLFTLLGKFTDEYRTLDTDLQGLLESQQYDDAYSLIHTLKGVTGNLGLFALHNASKPVESAIRNDKELPNDYSSFVVLLNETVSNIDTLTAESTSDNSANAKASNAPVNSAAAERARKQLISALKASEFISQSTLEEWLSAMGIENEKREAIIDAVDELDYEEALSELDAK